MKNVTFYIPTNTVFDQTILLCMRYITTVLYDNLNNKILSWLVMIDLKKVFDTVLHERLLLKLEHYVVRGVALQLLKNYRTDRKNMYSKYKWINLDAETQ